MSYKIDIIVVLLTLLYVNLFNGCSLKDKVTISMSVILFVISMIVIVDYIHAAFNIFETIRFLVSIILATIILWTWETCRWFSEKVLGVDRRHWNVQSDLYLFFFETLLFSFTLKFTDLNVVKIWKEQGYITE
ncbi:uncharacterized protein LOC111615022 [Centruroides sculpturatus]|uniref:uncharacterized protein LOC111615022 n=1 Tax=Centruroides sculpturatus TaxID=218467 RepID=UPI000C6CA73E|nr:uncharacterized protein LOC111615022 [Centruroides sculpturatus]